ERIGVLLAQVDLVVRTAKSEPHGLVRRAAIKVVFQRDGYSLSHPQPPQPRWCLLPYTGECLCHSRNAADQRQVPRNQSPKPEQIFLLAGPFRPSRLVTLCHPSPGRLARGAV